MRWLLLTLTMVAGFEAPALAGGQYQIFQGMFDTRCRVVDADFVAKEPGVIVGLGGYATRAEAEAMLPKVCKEEQGNQEPAGGRRYLILQNKLDGSCSVVEAGGPSGFATRAEAEAKLAERCKPIK
jgi:hypothetical protein